MKEYDSAEETEEISRQQREVHRCSAGHFHHHRHKAVQAVHAQHIGEEEEGCGETFIWLLVFLYENNIHTSGEFVIHD